MSCMRPLKSIVGGSIMNSIARKPVVGKFDLHMSRLLLHVYRLSRHAQFVSFYVNYAYLVNISVKLHIALGVG